MGGGVWGWDEWGAGVLEDTVGDLFGGGGGNGGRRGAAGGLGGVNWG